MACRCKLSRPHLIALRLLFEPECITFPYQNWSSCIPGGHDGDLAFKDLTWTQAHFFPLSKFSLSKLEFLYTKGL